MSFTDSSNYREISVLEKMLNNPNPKPKPKPKWYYIFCCCFYKNSISHI